MNKGTFTFGSYNSCSWLCLSDTEELDRAMDKFRFTNNDKSRYVELINEGHTVFVNNAGGYHFGDIAEKTNLVESNNFPR